MDKYLQRKPGVAAGDQPNRASGSSKQSQSSDSARSSQPDGASSSKTSGDAKSRSKDMGQFFASRTTAVVSRKNLPWVDKYRPKTIDEIAFQTDVVAVLRKSLRGEDFPHMLFYGPPGTGKTSSILAVCRELFGPELMKERVLELNASDERGISVVREKVKTFAQYSTTSIRPDGKMCPPFKIIILDEADSMTGAAQAALRRIMEKESKGTRFCLICNYISRIIEPLASRCARFRFKPLPTGIIKDRLNLISGQEEIHLEDKALDALIAAADGDLRRAITLLQSISKLLKGTVVKRSDVLELTGYVPDDQVTGFLEICRTSNYDKVQKFVNEFIFSGYGAGQLFSQLYETVLESTTLKDHQKALIMEELGTADHRLMDGADEFLQMMTVASTMIKAWKTPK